MKNKKFGVLDEKDPYSQKFPFIGDNIFLIAHIDPESLKQYLEFIILGKNGINIEYKDELECIHTAITQISYDEYEKLMQDPESKQDFINKVFNIKSTEIFDVNLSFDDKFFAFKSWVQGIAEAGMDALLVQSEIENSLSQQMPISQFLCKNLIFANPSFIPEFLVRIEKECRYEGIFHKPSLRANLIILISALSDIIIKKYKSVQSNVWQEKIAESLLIDSLIDIVELDCELIFQYSEDNNEIRCFLAERPEFTRFDEYHNFFTDPNYSIRQCVAMNPSSMELPEYTALIRDENVLVRWGVARNPNAVKLPEFQLLFNDESDRVKEGLAANPNATDFPEYRNLFLSDNEIILGGIAKNPNAVRFPEFIRFFSDYNIITRSFVALNPNATNLPEYHKLFHDPSFLVRRYTLENPNSPDCPDKKALIPLEYGFHLRDVLKHEKVNQYEEYRWLFKDADEYSRREVASNKFAPNCEEYRILFKDKSDLVRKKTAENLNATKVPEYKSLFADKNKEVRISVAKNHNAVTFPEFILLLSDKNSDVRKYAAKNPNAKKMYIEFCNSKKEN
jgi:hypothetical protein